MQSLLLHTMKKRINCWEYFKCGREPGGKNVDELGVCKAANFTNIEYNMGDSAGRICWNISGTLCVNNCPESHKNAFDSCLRCEFFHKVRDEEGNNFKLIAPLTDSE